MTFSKFDTQSSIEETATFEPTAQDWADYGEYCDERDAEAAAAGEDEQGDWDVADDWAELDGQPDEAQEWQDHMGGDEYYDHSEASNGGEW